MQTRPPNPKFTETPGKSRRRPPAASTKGWAASGGPTRCGYLDLPGVSVNLSFGVEFAYSQSAYYFWETCPGIILRFYMPLGPLISTVLQLTIDWASFVT